MLIAQEEASLILIVQERGPGKPAGAVAAPIGNAVFAVPLEMYYISTVLRIDTYEYPIVGTSDTWTGCARSIVKDLRAWVDANHARLRQ